MHWAPKFGGRSWGTTLGPPTLLAPCRARGTQVTLTLWVPDFSPASHMYTGPPTPPLAGVRWHRVAGHRAALAPAASKGCVTPTGAGRPEKRRFAHACRALPRGTAAPCPRVPNREVTVRLKLCKCGRPPGGAPPALLASSLPRPAGAVQFLPFPLASQQIPLLLTFARGGFGGLHLASKPRHPQNP